MTRITRALLASILLGLLSPGEVSAGEERLLASDEAWKNWENGEIDEAQRRAGAIADANGGKALLFLSAAVKGRYEDALELYAGIEPTYERLDELAEPVVNAYLHLKREEDAERFARGRELDPILAATVELRAARPLKARLDGITEVPFSGRLFKPFLLRPYFPPFDAELEGQAVTVHVDTGGSFLHMSPERANSLGIDFAEAGSGKHGLREVPVKLGIANAFKLGDAVLENVPVAVLPSLSGSQDFIIFGTNVLEQFHSTLDYPRKRLILSPRDDDEFRKRHMQMLPGRRVEMPFYLWGDHYMFARGGFSDHRSLNFFIDSGLVKLGWSRSWLRQACFATTPAHYTKWGVEKDAAERELFQSGLPISLGELEQRDQLFTPTPELHVSSFGGVRIDGLLSHAFLKRYAWTIDFDRGVYVFSSEGE